MTKKNAGDAVDHELLRSEFESPDELLRSKAIGSVCPCRNSWELFEQHVHLVSRLTRDRSRAVRATALHVFDDATFLQSIEDAEYRFQSVEEKLRKKRAGLLRSGKAQIEVRRTGRFKKRKGTFVPR